MSDLDSTPGTGGGPASPRRWRRHAGDDAGALSSVPPSATPPAEPGTVTVPDATGDAVTVPGATGGAETGSDAARPGAATGPAKGERAPGRPDRPAGNPVGWTALLVAVVLTVWQAVYALTVQGVAAAGQDTYTSVSLFVSLVLGLAAAVLGVVGISQRRRPRWPSLVGLAVGLNVFLVSVFSWIGGLMNTGA